MLTEKLIIERMSFPKPKHKKCDSCGEKKYVSYQIKAPRFYHYHCIKLDVCSSCICEYVNIEEPSHIQRVQLYRYKINKLKKISKRNRAKEELDTEIY